MLTLSNDQVSSLLSSLDFPQILHILDALARALADHTILQPPRQSFNHPPPASATTLIMPTFASSTSSVKIVSLDTSPASKNTSPKGSLLLFSPDGSLDAVLNASEVTGFRTALASMIPVVLRFLPGLVCENYAAAVDTKPIPLNTVLVFGAGLQAEWAIKLLLILCDYGGLVPTKITIVNRTLDRTQKLIEKVHSWCIEKLLPNHLPAFDCVSFNTPELQTLVTAADAIFCCTPSRKPHFPAFYLRSEEAVAKTRYISAIGSYTPEMEEIDPGLLADTSLKFSTVVDTIEGCLAEAGEIIACSDIRKRLYPDTMSEPWLQEVGVLWHEADQVGSRRSGIRRVMVGNVFYKSVGTGAMDLAVAKELVRIARGVGSGVDVPGF